MPVVQTSTIAARQLSEDSVEDIAAAADTDAALFVVTAPPQIDAAAAIVGTLDPDGTHQANGNVWHLVPEGTRWTVAELVSEVIDRARFPGEERRHLVMADAHLVSPGAMDRFLKLLEEPPAGVTVWLVCPDLGTLPPALVGRAAATLDLSATSRAAQRATLGELLAAYDITASAEQLDLTLTQADGDLALAVAVHRFELFEQLACRAQPAVSATPTVDAAALTLALAHLATALHHKTKKAPAAPTAKKGNLPTADLSRLNPAAKASLRRLVSTQFLRWESELADELAAAETGRARVLCNQLLNLRKVREGEKFSAPVGTLLAAGKNAIRA